MRWNTLTYNGWGRAVSATADVARPERHGVLTELISDSDHILPFGNLRSYGDAALTVNQAVSTARLDRMLAFDPNTGVLEAEAGVTLGQILSTMAPKGWMPPVLPGTGMTTLGGAIANDIHGKNHHVAGSFGQFVEQLTLLTAEGKTRVLTPGDDADLFRATLGGVGQTGMITAAAIRLSPCPSRAMHVRETRMPDLSAFLARFDAVDAPFQVGWIDALATGAALGRGLMEEADFDATAAAKVKRAKTRKLPGIIPGLAMWPPVVRAFNSLYYHRVPRRGRSRQRALEKFFFPLDRISNWNILYGKRGFHQFQCVLPHDGAETALRGMLEAVAAARLASPLAVLKRMGPGRAGYLSFAMEGFTLALDIPNRRGAEELLARLEAMTLTAGGRIYLAKDSAMSAESVAAMYPELGAFRDTVAAVDPNGKFVSAMSERLNLRGAMTGDAT